MSIKSEKKLIVFSREIDGVRVTVTIDPETYTTSMTYASPSNQVTIPLPLHELELLGEFIGEVLIDEEVVDLLQTIPHSPESNGEDTIMPSHPNRDDEPGDSQPLQ